VNSPLARLAGFLPALPPECPGIAHRWEVFSHDRDAHYYRGRLHHSSGDFLGIPRRTRESRRHDREVRDLLDQCNELTFAAFPYQDHRPIEEQAQQAGAEGT
jgi:hypothetical protein